MGTRAAAVLAELQRNEVNPGDLVGLVITARRGVGMATPTQAIPLAGGMEDSVAAIRLIDEVVRPRWVVWSQEPALAIRRAGGRITAAWDVAAVHRLLFGGWQAEPGRIWALAHRLDVESVPLGAPADLFTQASGELGDPGEPIGPDGYLRAEWVEGGWSASPERLAKWAAVAVVVATVQQARLGELVDRPSAGLTARSESTAELLCAELSVDGLPMDRAAASGILTGLIGPRPRSPGEAAAIRSARDAEVLRALPAGVTVDLRSPAQVRAVLAEVGVVVPDTRAWRLRALRHAHPLVDALLAWRKAERIATTYGYQWLDQHLGADGRLRGRWTGCDGAAGRMTASAGLHNMPVEMRGAVIAEEGHVFVRADLGQIEPRVLAAVSGDRALAQATRADDMYAPVAEQMGVDRATAKVAVLGAMYGQTTGHGAQALPRLKASYPVAMAYLDDADRDARAGRDQRTYGGRLIAMGPGATARSDGPEPRERVAARGRYGRNALIQGAAAELFKMWAVTVRARGRACDAQVVLCLHDELLVHTPVEHGDVVARLLDDCLQETARRWAPDGAVRFVAATSVIHRWSDGKAFQPT